jgi:hypothetical protein
MIIYQHYHLPGWWHCKSWTFGVIFCWMLTFMLSSGRVITFPLCFMLSSRLTFRLTYTDRLLLTNLSRLPVLLWLSCLGVLSFLSRYGHPVHSVLFRLACPGSSARSITRTVFYSCMWLKAVRAYPFLSYINTVIADTDLVLASGAGGTQPAYRAHHYLPSDLDFRSYSRAPHAV